MNTLFEINDTVTGNIMGLILIITLVIGNFKRLANSTRENALVRSMIVIVGVYCALELISGLIEGRPGAVVYNAVWIIQTLVYSLNVLLGYFWARFIAQHLGYTLKKTNIVMMRAVLIVSLAGLILNRFTQLVFGVDESNRYAGGGLEFVYILVAMLFTGHSVYVYLKCRANGGELKFFPIWVYITPSVAGILFEGLTGCGAIGPCNSIALAGVLGAMQDELVYRDRLTGVYNRSYLEEMRRILEKKKNPYVSGIMLDLNDFKHINDDFGHSEGDAALALTASIVRDAVGTYGDVIRYAGDEFIVIMNTWNMRTVDACVDSIKAGFDAFNTSGEKPYQLEVSIGYAGFNAENQSVNEFLNLIDKNMYESKRRFYEDNPERSRRRD